MKKFSTISIVIPVYNEEKTIKEIISIVRKADTLGLKKELILVDDCSKDSSLKILKSLVSTDCKIFHHGQNQGKGAAMRTGFSKASGDIVLIQDADLEYDPNEYPNLLKPILEDRADVVFGSRFMGGAPHRVLYYWHMVANNLLTTLSNIFSDLNLTDMETCYKVFTRKVIEQIEIVENRFGMEPEITAKLGQLVRTQGIRVYEVGISYYGRTYEEGKKIGYKDAIRAFWCILYYNNSNFAVTCKYFINGLVVALAQFIAMVMLVKILNFRSIEMQNIANIISIEFAILVAFYLHSTITWRKQYSTRRELIRVFFLFQLITITSVIVRIIVFYFLSKSGMGYLLNTLIGIIIAIFINFLGYNKIFSKLVISKKKEKINVTRGFGLLENYLARKRANFAIKSIEKAGKGGAILDLGCGREPMLLTLTNTFTKRYGLDQIIDAQTNKRYHQEKINLIKWDITSKRLPFKDKSFDVVSLLAVIEHIDELSVQKLLSDVKRLLKSDGLIIITTPAKWTEMLLKIFVKLRLVSPIEINEHKEQFTRGSLIKILTNSGFSSKNISCSTFNFSTTLWATAKKS